MPDGTRRCLPAPPPSLGDARLTLRQHAEAIARRNADRLPASATGLDTPDAQEALHELEVHQIELEMEINELRRTQAALDAARARYFDFYDLAPVGYCSVNERGLISQANLSSAAMLGLPRQALLQQPFSRFVAADDQDRFYLFCRQLFNSGESLNCELHLVKAGGAAFWAQLSALAVPGDDAQRALRLVLSDVSQQHEHIEAIHQLAFYDPLTRLPNRRLLLDRLQQALLNSARTALHGGLLFLDLDNFKQVNDTLGHDVGDLLLQQVAQRLQACVREGDSVSRLSGDEFVLLLEGLSSQAREAAAQAQASANKILTAVNQPCRLGEHSANCSASIGIVIFTGTAQSVTELLKQSDIALYQAKDAGRNTLRFYDAAMQAAVLAHSARVIDLKRGLAQHEFVLHYQIQVNQQGEPIGVEALARWQHATRGLISPTEFIALAEETRLILPLGQWVLEAACAQLAAWAGQPQTARLTVSVNVSALQFAQTDFVDGVRRALQQTDATPGLLKLELTESMLVRDVDDVIAKMTTLNALGVRFELDDFGTGFSSLSYLQRLPLERLKIDQSFVRDILSNPNSAVIAGTVVALGHGLGLQVIAEGVETAAQRELLTAQHCDAFQGYLFGRPVPVGELLGLTCRPTD